MRKRILIGSLTLTVAVFSAWEVALQRPNSKVWAQSPPPDISTYTSIENPKPFTLVTATTITGSDLDHVLRGVETTYVNRRGDILKTEERFTSGTSTVPTVKISQMNKREDFEYTAHIKFPNGAGAEISTSKKPYKALFWHHALPEKNCITPDPGISLLRNEVLTINGVPHPTAVVSHKSVPGDSPVTEAVMWRSLELGCQVIKSTFLIDPAPGGGNGYTVQEPVSLTIGEPPPEEFTQHADAVARAEHILPEKWEERIRSENAKMHISAKVKP